MAKIETGTEARQGSKGKPALYVLIASMVLMIAAVAIALTWQGANAPTPPATQTSRPPASTPAGSGGAGETAGNPATPSPAQTKAQ